MKRTRNFTSFLESLCFYALLAFVLVFVGLRVIALTSSPPGFFVDESSIGYNAWTILKSGADEHGSILPLYFKAFGDYKNPIFVYSVSLLFLIVGPSIEAVRLSAALWGLGAIGSCLFLLYSAKASRWVMLITALIIVTNPWFFQLSRVAFEVASLPFFLFVAMIAFYKLTYISGTKNINRPVWLCMFALSLGLMFYSYTSARMLAPGLFFVGLALSYRKIPWKSQLVSAALFLACLLPALIWEISNPGALLARYQVVGLSNYTHSTQEFIRVAASQYLAHFLPHFLIEGGDGNLRHIPSPYGVLLVSSLPFLITGIISACTKRRSPFSWWIIIGLLLSPIPSALTIQSPHVLRSVDLLVFMCILFWFGVEYVFTHLNLTAFGIVCCTFLCVEALIFASAYFHSYSNNAGIWFDRTTVEAIDVGASFPGPYYLSSKLYPGTYATVDFLRIVHDPRQSIPLEEPVMFDPSLGIPEGKGVFFFDSDTCRTLPEDFSDSATRTFESGGNCIYTR